MVAFESAPSAGAGGVAAPQAVLDFWFGAPGSAEFGSVRQQWFEKSDVFDAEIRERFLATWDFLSAPPPGQEHWDASAHELLAYLIVIDQFSRNLFRDDPRAFACDAAARNAAGRLLSRGWDSNLHPRQRAFTYLPLMHAEHLADQDACVQLFERLAAENPGQGFEMNLDYAKRHREVIERFGRFPHRNSALGRESTPDEAAFVATPGTAF